MTVLLDTARHRFVFPHHASHISYTGHLATGRVAEDNLIGYLLLGFLLSLHMNGHLLVFIADAAGYRCDALSLKTGEEHLLSNTVGLQSLTVDIERDLFLLLTKQLHICY